MAKKAVDVEQIAEMLRDTGLSPQRADMPGDNWRLHFPFPAGAQELMEIINLPNLPKAIAIGVGVTMSPEHVERFGNLETDEKAEFVAGLSETLTREFCEYNIHGAAAPGECPPRFDVSTVRYEDGLTLDSLNRTMTSIHKAKLAGINFVRRRLANDPDGGGQFEFKRVGLQ